MLEDRTINLWSYNLETILAEKVQTILARERANTRMRDFYDIYVLQEKYNSKIKTDIFQKSYEATCRKRGTLYLFGNETEILDIIASDDKINNQWISYQKKFAYASNISFKEIIICIKQLISFLSKD